MSTSSYSASFLKSLEEKERKKKEAAERRKREHEEKRALKEKEKGQKRSATKQTRSKVHCKGKKKSVRRCITLRKLGTSVKQSSLSSDDQFSILSM